MTPLRGPVGTPVVLQSITPCLNGIVYVDVFYRLRSDAAGSAFYSTHAAPDGTWSVSFPADPGAFGTDGPADVAVT